MVPWTLDGKFVLYVCVLVFLFREQHHSLILLLYNRDKLDPETQLKKRAIELNQGRAAQMGLLALMVHEKLGVSLLPGGLVVGE